MRSCLLQRHSALVRTCLLLLLNCAILETVSAQIVDTPTTLYRIAGSPFGDLGMQDGVGPRAGFFFPSGLIKRNAQLWVVDRANHTIRQIQPDGRVETPFGLGGSCGVHDGTKEDARFCSPVAIALDSKGFLYVTDALGSTVRKILGGSVRTVAGVAKVCGDSDSVSKPSLCAPRGVAADSSDNLYVADNSGVIRKFAFPTGEAKTIAGSDTAGCGSADGNGAAARFCFPTGLAIDPRSGNLYVADTYNHTIRKVTPEGVVSTVAGKAKECGIADGASEARFCFPQGIAVDGAGNLYVADTRNSTIRQITPEGLVSTVAGKARANRTNLGSLPGTIANPIGIAVIGDRRLAITTENHEVLGINF
jgi:DNA-binding beta-propeller fold protein YncE